MDKDLFGRLPQLECSNSYIEHFFRYRWENLKKMSFDFGRDHPILPYPGIYEGPGYFQRHISYSAWAHILELRWLESPVLAQGSILNFVHNQRSDGSFPGHLGPDGTDAESFYHADWGRALLELQLLHPSGELWETAYNALTRYVAHFDSERCKEGTGLYDVVNHFETGQEFSPRYIAVCHDADRENWGSVFRLKGVDATIYIYELYRALSVMAAYLPSEKWMAQFWKSRARSIRASIRKLMWDRAEEMFFDIDPMIMTRTRVKALTCFYPYMTDVVLKKDVAGLKTHIANHKEFWTEFPFPTVSLDDPYFSAEGIWRGKKEICPWNGRVWPMTNSHMAEAIATTAIRFEDRALRAIFAEFFARWMRMMSFDGDATKPNSFEHYNPHDGSPSDKEHGFAGINDYLHSWINDIIIKYVAGFRPQRGNVVIVDPFPLGVSLKLSGLHYKGREITVEVTEGGVTSLRADGKLEGRASVGTPTVRTLK